MTPMTLADDEIGDDVPSPAFLEFLGEWEDAQGDWQDPLEYVTPDDDLGTQVPGANVEQNDETH